MDPNQVNLQEEFTKRFKQLPPVVQNAIMSADVEKHMRELADTNKLHIDQWQKLENEVMLILLGFENKENLIPNLIKEVGVDGQTAFALAEKISEIVFEPIRLEMERQLGHPSAQEKVLTDAEAARETILSSKGNEPTASSQPLTSSAPVVVPSTPASPLPAEQEVRTPVSESYRAATPSTDRRTVEGDPYRESPL